MPVAKIADEHPYYQRTYHIKVVEGVIYCKAAHRPDNKNQEETAQNGNEPIKVDVLLVREALLKLAMILTDEEEEHDKGCDAINGTPYRQYVKEEIMARIVIKLFGP